MRSSIRYLLLSLFFVLNGCVTEDSTMDLGETSQEVISWTNANNLINAGRAQIGTTGGQCKAWVQNTTSSSYGVWIAANDSTYQYKWTSDTTPATNVARWLGSYANGRLGPTTLAGGGGTTSTSFSESYGDPQVIVLYASTSNVTATITKSGSATLSVTSTGLTGGSISSSTTTGTGTWTLTVTNNGGSSASGVVAVVLSRSRFQSDWETARRGDIMQMYVGTDSSNRGVGGPHTTFVQTDYNANSTCGGDTTGCNWLDSNWVASNTVGAHNVSMDTMMKMVAYSSSYGFTVYRLN